MSVLEFFRRFFAILCGDCSRTGTKRARYRLSQVGIVETVDEVAGESKREYLWADVTYVGILTTSDGPWSEDVFFIIKTDQGSVCIDHSQAVEIKLFEQFAMLPGFSYEQVVLAMGCTDDASFKCWEKSMAMSP